MEAQFIADVLRLTNDFRAQNGLDPLTANAELDATAEAHSKDMAQQDYFSHTGKNGSKPWDRAETFGYEANRMGENIAAGQRSPEQVVQGWIDSPGHRANLLNPSYTELGVGYHLLENDTGSVNYNTYWTQVFGSGDRNPETNLPGAGSNNDPAPAPAPTPNDPPAAPPAPPADDAPDPMPAPISGTAGNDTMDFGDGSADVKAGSGNDLVYSTQDHSGGSTIDLGRGSDSFWSPTGNNTIVGSDDNAIGIGTGNNSVKTAGGDDFVYSVEGGGGRNTLNLSGGSNTVWVEGGSYKITAGSGVDTVGLGIGVDTVSTGGGNDVVYMVDAAKAGDKNIRAGAGDDYVETGAGDDLIDGGAGLNTLYGGAGTDVFTVQSNAYNFIGDFEAGVDQIALKGIDFSNLGFSQGTGDTAMDAFISMGDKTLAQVSDTSAAALESQANFV